MDKDIIGYRNIAVLDLTHAGGIIAKKLASRGFNVTAVDVYSTLDSNMMLDLEEKHDIATSHDPLNVNAFDLLISPTHLDPKYPMLTEAREKSIDIMSHHMAVGQILSMSNSFDQVTVIEITGSKAKTSSASLLAKMLSKNMKVVLHTTRGLEIWNKGHFKILHLGLSIAPGSILLAIDIIESIGIDAECYIFEVSLGLTGQADIGVITTLGPDYRIAASTAKASDSKTEVFKYGNKDEIFFLNAKDKMAIEAAKEYDRCFFTFITTEEKDIERYPKQNLHLRLEKENIIIEQNEHILSINTSTLYDPRSYITAFAASCSVASWMGLPYGSITEAINSFNGLQGRMQEKNISNRIMIDNSNSGMDIGSAEQALDYAMNKYKASSSGMIMIIGEEASQVCEGLPPEDVSMFLAKRCRDISKLILVGSRMQNICKYSAIHAPGLGYGIEKALELSSEKDIIISCVKCFR